MLAVIGDQFGECRNVAKVKTGDDVEWPEISGCTISVRQSEDIITLWNQIDGDVKVREQIRSVSRLRLSLFDAHRPRDTLRKVLNLPPSTVMEYKSNNGAFNVILLVSAHSIPTFSRLDAGQVELPTAHCDTYIAS